MEWHRGDYTISTHPDRVDLDVVHGFLQGSYWAAGVPRDVVERSVRHALVFAVLRGEEQVGFARVVTDRATFAWVGDVFVLPGHRGRGLAGWLMEVVTGHPELQGLRRWMLATADAHGLYARYGFAPLADPGRFMERRSADYGA